MRDPSEQEFIRLAVLCTGRRPRLARVKFVGRRSYIYALLSGGVIVYVGRTTDLTTRLASHQNDKRGEWDEAIFFRVKPDNASFTESMLIRHLRPALNGVDIRSKRFPREGFDAIGYLLLVLGCGEGVDLPLPPRGFFDDLLPSPPLARPPVASGGASMSKPTTEFVEKCINCGDGCGWHRWNGNWAMCADCNDDGKKPKPILCDHCGETPAFCLCARHPVEARQ